MSIPRTLALSVLFILSTNAYSQDVVYLKGGSSSQGKIIDISPKAVIVRAAGKKSSFNSFPAANTLLAVKNTGKFLCVSALNWKAPETLQAINDFLSGDTARPASDRLYLKTKQSIDCRIISEDAISVEYTKNDVNKRKVEKSQLAVIINKGIVVLLTDPKEAADVLSHSTVFNESIAMADSQATVKRQPKFEELAPNVSPDDFKRKAKEKTDQLNTYLKILCDKNASPEEANKAINLGVALFVSEKSIVEVSSANRSTVRSKPIRTYLTDVKALKYDKIEIEWTSVQYVDNIQLGPDGNYYGTISFEQVFRGYRDNQLVYSDITRKDATVMLKTYSKTVEGVNQAKWDVLLNDIAVTSTKL